MEKSIGEKILDSQSAEIEVLRQMMVDAKSNGEVDSVIKLAATIARITKEAFVAQYQLEQLQKTIEQRVTQSMDVDSEIDGVSHIGPQASEVLHKISELSKKLGGQKKNTGGDEDPAGEVRQKPTS